jgi:hypothetical protein
MTDATPDVFRKLQIKPPARVLLLGAPDGFAARLGAPPDGVELIIADAGSVALGAGFDAVLCPVRTAADIADRAPAVLAAARPDGLVWFAYPKRGKGTATDTTGTAAGRRSSPPAGTASARSPSMMPGRPFVSDPKPPSAASRTRSSPPAPARSALHNRSVTGLHPRRSSRFPR